ncbi:MAG: hypothetical protein MHM6MM_004965 [Cercozoa sp. M6MM]
MGRCTLFAALLSTRFRIGVVSLMRVSKWCAVYSDLQSFRLCENKESKQTSMSTDTEADSSHEGGVALKKGTPSRFLRTYRHVVTGSFVKCISAALAERSKHNFSQVRKRIAVETKQKQLETVPTTTTTTTRRRHRHLQM